MSVAASYYVSAVQAKGSTGTLAGLTVYPFSDVNIFSTDAVPVKTVATSDVVAVLNDGTYTMVKDCAPPAGTGSGKFTTIRGAKSSDGSFDNTRATRPTFILGGYKFGANANNIALADLEMTNPTGVTIHCVDLTGSSADRWLLYNLLIRQGSGTRTTSYGINSPNGAFATIVGCRIHGMTSGGITFAGPSTKILYCEVDDCADGIIGAASTAESMIAHNVVHDTNGNGFKMVGGTTGGIMLLHNSAFNNAADGFELDGNCYVTNMIGNLACLNGAWGYDIGACHGHVAYGNAGYGNVSGLVQHVTDNFVVNRGVTALSAFARTVWTPTTSTGIPELGELLQSESSGKNWAGALTNAASGGGGGGGGRGGISGPMGGAISNWSCLGG